MTSETEEETAGRALELGELLPFDTEETSRNVNGSDLWEKSRSKKHSKNKVFVFNI